MPSTVETMSVTTASEQTDEDGSSSTEYSDQDEDPTADDTRDSQQKENPCIVWTGYNRRIPVLVFESEGVKSKTSELKSVGEKYHLAYKIVRTECKLVRALLHSHGFHETHPNSSDFNLVWTGSHLKPYTLQSMHEFQKINHFPRSYEITRKDRLFKNIQRMQHLKGLKHFDFIPPSYVIPSEFQEFCTHYLKDKGPYIVKPIASSRGRGIFLVNHPEQVPLDEQVIVCKYVNNPLLVDGFKFDLRLYIAVTSYDPLLIYMYEEGLARFATVRFEKSFKSLKNQCMHLTNYSVNKKSGDFVQNDDSEVEDYGNKWSLGALLRYLRSEGHDTTALMMRIEDVVIKTIISAELPIATACKMFMPHKGNCFELYGFDILVDTNLRPWILEVNLSPSLACDAPLDLKIKSHLLADLFSLTGFVCHDPMVRKLQQSRRNQEVASKMPSRAQSAGASRARLQTRGQQGSVLYKKQRPSSANSLRESQTNKKFSGLTGEEIKLVRRAREENQRRGGFVRIFPTPDSWDLYSSFLQFMTTNNLTLHQKLFPERHKNVNSKNAPAGYSTSLAKIKSVHLHSAPSSTINLSLEGEEILTNAMRRSLSYERRLRTRKQRNKSAQKSKSAAKTAKHADKNTHTSSLRARSTQNGLPAENDDEDEEEEGDTMETGQQGQSSMFDTQRVSATQQSQDRAQFTITHATDRHTNITPDETDSRLPSMLVQKPGQPPSGSTSVSSMGSDAGSSSHQPSQGSQKPVSAGQKPVPTSHQPVANNQRPSSASSQRSTAEKPPPAGTQQQKQSDPPRDQPARSGGRRGIIMQGMVKPPKYDLPNEPIDLPPPKQPSPPPVKYNVVDVLEKGGQLSKVQARSAFATYLTRVQTRLQAETNTADPEDVEAANEQMDLVLRFLRRAAVNLQQTFKVIVPSRKLPLNDRRRILAKQLGDFVHLYAKETDLLRQKTKVDNKRPQNLVDEDKFDQYVNTACESDLEEVLTTYTKMNKSASIFLGGASAPNKVAYDRSTTSAMPTYSQSESSLQKQKESRENLNVDGKSYTAGRQYESVSDKSSYHSAVSIYSAKLAPPQNNRQRPSSASTVRSGVSRASSGSVYSRQSSGRPMSASMHRENPDGASVCRRPNGVPTLLSSKLNRAKTKPSAADNFVLVNMLMKGPKTFEEYNEDAINEALQRLALRQQARTYSSNAASANILSPSVSTQVGRPPPSGQRAHTALGTTRTRTQSSSERQVATSGEGVRSQSRGGKKPLANGVITVHSALLSDSYGPKYSAEQNCLQNGAMEDRQTYNGGHVSRPHVRSSTSDGSVGLNSSRSANSVKVNYNGLGRTANETFNNFIDDLDEVTSWQNDLARAYNQVTGVSPQNNYVASRTSTQFQVASQQQLMKQQRLVEASKKLLENSKAKHLAMIAHAHAAQKAGDAEVSGPSLQPNHVTNTEAPPRYTPKPPPQPSSGKKPTSSHRLARTALAEDGPHGNQFYSSIKYDSLTGATKLAANYKY